MRHLLILILTIALCTAQSADTKKAQSLMQAAQAKETIAGDLKGAIDLYRQAAKAARADRTVAVQAMLKVAECQERQGAAEARKTYEEIVRNFSDQKVAVELARRKLGVTAATETRTRLLWDNAIDTWGRATADGRYLSFVDWSTGDLAIRDLVTGENRRVTNKGGYEKALGEVERNSISPDGKRVAFAWDSWQPKAIESKTIYSLHLIDADGKNERVLREFPEDGYVEPLGWSADGKWLLVFSTAGRTIPRSRLEMVAVDSDDWKILLEFNSWAMDDALFSPDQKWVAYTERPNFGSEARVLRVVETGGSKARVTISEAATLLGWTPDGSGIVYRKKQGEAARLFVQNLTAGKAAGDARELRMQASGDSVAFALTAKGTLLYGTNNGRLDAEIVPLDASGIAGSAESSVLSHITMYI